MAQRTYVTCAKCGCVDRPASTYPPVTGTAATMVCPDCTAGQYNTYGHPLAGRCRACCPTGHGTHGYLEELS